MTNSVELLLIFIIAVAAIVTFIVSLRIRHKQQKQRELWRELQKQAETRQYKTEDSIIEIRRVSPAQPVTANTDILDSSDNSMNAEPDFKKHPLMDENPFDIPFESQTNVKQNATPPKENIALFEQSANKNSDYKASKLLICYIVAGSDQLFLGYDLLQALLAAGFRFGDMSIFHRHEKNNGEGSRLFSLAAANEPGTFDMNQIGAFRCKGLCLFMQLTGAEHNLATLNKMLETAEELAQQLNGKVLGFDKKPLNSATLEIYRDHIKQHLNQLEVV